MIWAVVVVLMALGMVLLVAEVAIIPGFGVAGLSAILFLSAGVATAWYHYGPAWGIGSLLVAGVLTLGVVVFVPRTRAGKSLVLETVIQDQQTASGLAELAGKAGVSVTALRPAGAVEIDGKRVDVTTDGQFIPAGVAVKVVSVEGSRVVVAADA